MTVDDDELGASLRDEELQVLKSIYPDYIVESTADSIRLEVPVELGSERHVELVPDAGSSTSISPSLDLTYLPRLLLTVSIPSAYPLHIPPSIVSIHATHSWLPGTSRLVQPLLQLWTEGEGTLYSWVEFIRSGEMLERLGYVDSLGNIRLPCIAPHLLKPLLLNYDAASASSEFSQNSYPCSICFSSVRGSQCVQLSCSHVFCRSCLQEFWGLCISEGSVERVGCADPECVKQGRQATEEEVRRVVSDEEVVRWKWLRSKKAMEKDPTIIHCPVPMCQAPVTKPEGVDAESGWSRFRTCTECGYHFCSFCKRTWHGPLSACPKSVLQTVILEYIELPDNSPERAAIERKFGRDVVRRLVKEYEDEQSTDTWLAFATTACPGCRVHVEKSAGCNHMTCMKCNQHFCYRCGSQLRATDPYQHFSQKGTECYGKLFDFHRGADEDWVFDFDRL